MVPGGSRSGTSLLLLCGCTTTGFLAMSSVGISARRKATILLVSWKSIGAGEELAQKANVTIDQARTIALKARHGTITDEELEREKGGSGLRYSFDIKSNKVIYEVGVDARTGKALENVREGAHPD